MSDNIVEALQSAAPPVELGQNQAAQAGVDEIDREWLESCPVTPLGQRDRRYWFLSPSGELHAAKHNELNMAGIIALFDGDIDWLSAQFPAFDREGQPVDDRFQATKAMIWLVKMCAAAGFFDSRLPVRRLGVWPIDARPSAGCVGHFGDHLLVWRPDAQAFERRAAGWRNRVAIYPLDNTVPAPAMDRPASADDCQLIEQLISCWRFSRECDARLLIGWVGQTLLGDLPDWHSHLLVSAPAGSGKSTLLEGMQAIAGPMLERVDDYTEAGLRQSLTDQARGVLLDELEPKPGVEGGGAVQMVLELIRRMSSGAKIVRGSAGGQVNRTTVTGNAAMFSVNPPPLTPQDRSRILGVRLKPVGTASALNIKQMTDQLAAASPRIRARALHGWARYLKNEAVYRQALIEAGLEGRPADVISGMLAGYDLLMMDEVADPQAARELVEVELGELISEVQVSTAEDGDAAQCLNFLLSSQCDAWRSGSMKTIGQMVQAALDQDDGRPLSDAEKLLHPMGLKLAMYPAPPPRMRPSDSAWRDALKRGAVWLLVSRNHRGLQRIYEGQRWAGGGWHESLMRLERGVEVWPKPQKFAGSVSRCVGIPLQVLRDYLDLDLPE